MKAIYKILLDPVGKVVDIPNELHYLQYLVGGWIETVTLASDMAIVCNESGAINGMTHNCNICGMKLHGAILVVGVDGEDFTDVPVGLEEWKKWIS